MHSKLTAEEVRDSSADSDSKPDTDCQTLPLVAAFSICLTKHRFCQHALSFGHQYLCRNPDHAKFVVPPPRKK